MTIAAEAHRAEGQSLCLKSALNKLKSLNFRFGTSRPTVIIIIIIIIIIIVIIITAACEQLAPTKYAKRHDGAAKVIHQKLAEAAELIEDKSPYCRYTPASVLENDSFKLYWNRGIIADK
jgi:hypothetical protein